MPAAKTLTVKTLEALGATRLAELMIEIGGRLGDQFHAAAKDLAPLAVVAGVNPDELARKVFEAVRVIGYGLDGPLYADQLDASHRERTIGTALRDIADAEGDIDGFIAQV